jgi:hypothetical protein
MAALGAFSRTRVVLAKAKTEGVSIAMTKWWSKYGADEGQVRNEEMKPMLVWPLIHPAIEDSDANCKPRRLMLYWLFVLFLHCCADHSPSFSYGDPPSCAVAQDIPEEGAFAEELPYFTFLVSQLFFFEIWFSRILNAPNPLIMFTHLTIFA